MICKRFREEPIVKVLEEASSGTPVTEACREHNISSPRFYEWKKQYGGMTACDVRELRTIDENRKLKKLLANALLENGRVRKKVATPAARGDCWSTPRESLGYRSGRRVD